MAVNPNPDAVEPLDLGVEKNAHDITCVYCRTQARARVAAVLAEVERLRAWWWIATHPGRAWAVRRWVIDRYETVECPMSSKEVPDA